MTNSPFDSQGPTPGSASASLPPALPAGQSQAPFVRLPKSPGLAAFLSLCPGLGQVYNGRFARAFVFFGAFVGSIILTATGHEFPFAFTIPFAYLWNLVDAWNGAHTANARFLGGRSEPDEPQVESPVWGVSLALIGVLILLNNLGWLDLDRLARWWPLILIALGGYFVKNSIEARRASGASGE